MVEKNNIILRITKGLQVPLSTRDLDNDIHNIFFYINANLASHNSEHIDYAIVFYNCSIVFSRDSRGKCWTVNEMINRRQIISNKKRKIVTSKRSMNIIVTFRIPLPTLLFLDRLYSLGASDGRRITNNYLSSTPIMFMIWNITRFSLSRFINRAICYWSCRVSINGLLKRQLISDAIIKKVQLN